MITALIERRQAIERFEFKSLFDCQTDEDTPSVFVDKIPPWRARQRGTLYATPEGRELNESAIEAGDDAFRAGQREGPH
jgi:hypothetical protein